MSLVTASGLSLAYGPKVLLADAGFVDVRIHHRHGYSWTVTGVRPQAGAAASA